MRFLLLCVCAACLVRAQAPDDKEDLKNPVAAQPEAIAAGRKLFLEGCSGCHGPTAEGGRGPNLAQGDQIRGATNRHLMSVLTEGVKGSDMPPSGLPVDKNWQVIAYLRNLTAVAFDSMGPGDAKAGEELFYGKAGCSSCHTIRGRGGYPGPDLTNIARVRSFRQLRQSLLDPDAQIADGYGGVNRDHHARPENFRRGARQHQLRHRNSRCARRPASPAQIRSARCDVSQPVTHAARL